MIVVEPNWIEVTTYGSAYDQEVDSNAKSGDREQYRYRDHSFSGGIEFPWKFGLPPGKKGG